MKIAYIGIGIMGRPMAANLLQAGHELFVHNRTVSKCDHLADQGATVCDCPADAADEADVVFINVTDTADVEQVIFGDGGIIEEAREGLIVIDNSTISPVATRDFAHRLRQKKVAFLDAPVSGGDVGAQKGILAIMVGGEKDIFDKCLPLFEILGSNIRHIGPVGSGQVCKACNQLFCALHMIACCEGIRLAQKSGIDPQTMVDVVSGGAGGSWALQNLGPKIINRDFDPGFMIDLLSKDLKFTLELAHEAGLPLMGTSLAQQLFHEAQDEGYGRLGTQALYKVIENLGP